MNTESYYLALYYTGCMENPFATERFRNLPEEGLTQIYRNPRIKLPFDPKDLALFLDRKNGKVSLRSLPYHHRSADLGISTIIREKDKMRSNVYCQFDVKGGGFLFPESHESKKVGVTAGDLADSPEAYLFPDSPETPWGYDALGLFDERMAQGTIKRADQLSALGMRTEAVVAMYRTDRIFLNGTEVPIKDFKQEAIERIRALAKEAESVEEKDRYRHMVKDIHEMFDPVVMVRVMRSVFRLRDFTDGTREQQLAMLEEACQNVNYEQATLGLLNRFNVKTSEGREAFLEFIANWYGKNAGILHGEGFVHIFLHRGNLTLAGEIVDLDSVHPMLKRIVFHGKPENKSRWMSEQQIDQPFTKATNEGCVIINPDVGLHRQPDERFRLPKCFVKDIRDLCFSLRMVLKEDWFKEQKNTQIRKRISQGLIKGYLDGLNQQSPLQAIGISREQMIEAFEAIANEVVRDGKNMSPIPPDEETEATRHDA